MTHNSIEELHRDWNQLHSRLREEEQRLSNDIAAYARGQAGRPDALMKEVEQMRAECAQRFKALMDAVRESTASASGNVR